MKTVIESSNCHFCDVRPSLGSCARSITLYREKRFGPLTRVEKTKVKIPRCRACRSIHRRYWCLSNGIGIGVAVAALSWQIATYWAVSWLNFAAHLAMATIIGLVLGEILERWYFEARVIPSRHGIKSRHDIHTAPVVRKMLYQYWKLKNPNPG